MFACAISNQTPEEPVVSKRTGHVFEKRVLEKYLASAGTCPITKEPMSMEDVVLLQAPKTTRPRPITATSIPGLLSLFQSEWDAVMLETFALKEQLSQVRQELAHALYQHDAACRVIARLVKERDQARSALAQATLQMQQVAATAVPTPAPGPSPEAMEVEGPKAKAGLNKDIISKMTSTAQALSKGRKKRQAPPTLASPEAIEQYSVLSSNPIHKSSMPGITCLDINPRDPKQTATGGVDTNVVLFNREAGKIAGTLSSHSKKITAVLFHPSQDTIFSASSDKTCKIWTPIEGGYKVAATLKDHTDEVVGCTIHATGEYIVTASLDKTWALYDIKSAVCLVQIADPNLTKGYTAVKFHPDGLILGTGTLDNSIRIWDVKSQQNVATFEGHTGPIHDMAFSENGYYLATCSDDSTVKLWDLRKAGVPDQCNFRTISYEDNAVPRAVDFDQSGHYLAASGPDVRVFAVRKDFSVIKTFTDHTAAVTDVLFGPDASFLASTSMDRTLKFFGAPA